MNYIKVFMDKHGIEIDQEFLVRSKEANGKRLVKFDCEFKLWENIWDSHGTKKEWYVAPQFLIIELLTDKRDIITNDIRVGDIYYSFDIKVDGRKAYHVIKACHRGHEDKLIVEARKIFEQRLSDEMVFTNMHEANEVGLRKCAKIEEVLKSNWHVW